MSSTCAQRSDFFRSKEIYVIIGAPTGPRDDVALAVAVGGRIVSTCVNIDDVQEGEPLCNTLEYVFVNVGPSPLEFVVVFCPFLLRGEFFQQFLFTDH